MDNTVKKQLQTRAAEGTGPITIWAALVHLEALGAVAPAALVELLAMLRLFTFYTLAQKYGLLKILYVTIFALLLQFYYVKALYSSLHSLYAIT